jgi:hypothetical protein
VIVIVAVPCMFDRNGTLVATKPWAQESGFAATATRQERCGIS